MSDELNVDLKPCPFCGKHELKKETFLDLIGWVYRVQCKYCGTICQVSQISLTDMEDAIRNWNTRPLEDEKDREIDSLKVELNNLRHFCDSILEMAKLNNGVLYFKQDSGIWKIETDKDNDVPANDTENTKEVKDE